MSGIYSICVPCLLYSFCLCGNKSVCEPSDWFLYRLQGIESVGVEWGVGSKLGNDPNLVLTFILLSFYIIFTYVDFD